MQRLLTLPTELHHACDDAIRAVQNGARDLAAESRLAEWLEGPDAYEALVETGGHIGLLCDFSQVSAGDIREQLELAETAELTCIDRARYVRETLEQAHGDAEGPYIEPYLICNDAGQEAYVSMLGTCSGQGGFVFKWHGLFTTQEAIVADLQRPFHFLDCLLVGQDVEAKSDDELAAALPV